MKEAAPPPHKTPAELATGSPPASHPIRSRTRSTSSSASSLSSTILSSSPSPAHRYLFPLRSSSAVPFSWEHLPGVPKNPKSLPSPTGPSHDPIAAAVSLPLILRRKKVERHRRSDRSPPHPTMGSKGDDALSNPGDAPEKDQTLILTLPPPLRSKPDPSTPRKKRSDARFAHLAADDPFAAALAECTKDDPAGTELVELWGEPSAGAPRRRALATAAFTQRFGIFDLYGSCKISCSVADAIIHVPRSTHRPATYGVVHRRSSS
ncbi:hypothetical protein COCNU_02G010990 [Cocos nucifera]|uniref:Uncharacterized protein n=1 Tax=Cocos nucifera TaxID=13894 RepID=A0A8K0MWY0_COCNU|nr:hypothetical protein COCNU_02G010990 [Cocos nucifera]